MGKKVLVTTTTHGIAGKRRLYLEMRMISYRNEAGPTVGRTP